MRTFIGSATTLSAIFLRCRPAHAFGAPPPTASRPKPRRTALGLARDGAPEGDDGDGGPSRLERDRRSLERLAAAADGDGGPGARAPSPTVPPLTAARRRTLEREIEILSSLGDDATDDAGQERAVAELWALWYGERGRIAERELREIEETFVEGGDPSLWPVAEEKYRDLIERYSTATPRPGGYEYGSGNIGQPVVSSWVEPCNRLATLLYLMERYAESKVLCERILHAKPWHVGALSGIVAVSIKLNDAAGAQHWALRRLPNVSNASRSMRKIWIERNVLEAKKRLKEMELVTLQTLGEDSGNANAKAQTDDGDVLSEEESSAWQ